MAIDRRSCWIKSAATTCRRASASNLHAQSSSPGVFTACAAAGREYAGEQAESSGARERDGRRNSASIASRHSSASAAREGRASVTDDAVAALPMQRAEGGDSPSALPGGSKGK